MPEMPPPSLCFMVMPFGRKPVVPPADNGVAEIDFDALWSQAFEPVIRELGYEPVRADQDIGALIIQEMLERLYFSDVVVADITIPNGNVYYEIGIRHASKPTGCVLVSADWARPLFDITQMRRLTYPLTEGRVTPESAERIRQALRDGARQLIQGASPMYQALPGFPHKVKPERSGVVREHLRRLSEFQAQLREARLAPSAQEQRRLALELKERLPAVPPSPSMAVEIAYLLRDCVGWGETLAYLEALPEEHRQLDALQELRCLALSKNEDHLKAIAGLEELVRLRGDSSERRGLLGGRYKKLAAASRGQDARLYRRRLDQAIEQYERGMRLDLNDYYPSSNLPRLYRERKDPGDIEKAAFTWQLARQACERALERSPSEAWARQTLLGLAFDGSDMGAARACAREVEREGPARWQLETTIDDLDRSVAQQEDAERRRELGELVDGLRQLLPKPEVRT
jgi:tetratricopeptide (TPR) repeat protein